MKQVDDLLAHGTDPPVMVNQIPHPQPPHQPSWWQVQTLDGGSREISQEALTHCRERAPICRSEAERIVAATDLFGVLTIALREEQPPSDTEIHKAFEEIRARLDHERVVAPATTPLEMEVDGHARFKANRAWYALRHRGIRLRQWIKWYNDPTPITQTIECPVDMERLNAFLASPDAALVESTSRKTYGAIAAELLKEVHRTELGGAVGWLTLHYRHSNIGARLTAAGYVSYSREYVKGVDPFRLPRPARHAALGRMGLDIDDHASYPTAAVAMLEAGREVAAAFLANRELILARHGDHYFNDDGTFSDKEKREWVKELYNSLDMDGSVQAWRRKYAEEILTASVAQPQDRPPPLDLPNGQSQFTLEGYEAAAKERTQEMCDMMPTYMQYVKACNVARGKADKQHPLTGKSYVFQHHEGQSRMAKQVRAQHDGHSVINLQHDGVFVRMMRGANVQAVRAALQEASTAAVGYEQCVTIKWIGERGAEDPLMFTELVLEPAAHKGTPRPPFAERGGEQTARRKLTRRGRRAPRHLRAAKPAEPQVTTIAHEAARSLSTIAWEKWNEADPRHLTQWLAQLGVERLRLLYGALCTLALRRGTWRRLRDIAAEQFHSRQVVRHQRRKRSLFINGFVAEACDALCLSKLLMQEEIRSLVPQAIWADVGAPMAVWKYAVPPFLTIQNFSTTARTLDSTWWRTWAVDDGRCRHEGVRVAAALMERQRGVYLPEEIWAKIRLAAGEPAPPLLRRCNHLARPYNHQPAAEWSEREIEPSEEGPSCICCDPRYRRFLGADGHVMTKDLDIIGMFDEELKELMSKGPKHRCAHASTRKPPEDAGYELGPRGDLKFMFDGAFDTYIKDKEERYGYNSFIFTAWREQLSQKLYGFVDELSETKLAEIEMQQRAAEEGPKALAKRVRRFHRCFVFSKADKESVYTVCCRHCWEQKVMAELESGVSYAHEGGGAAAVHAWRQACSKAKEEPDKHTMPMQLPLMHTEGMATQRPPPMPMPIVGPQAPTPPPAPVVCATL